MKECLVETHSWESCGDQVKKFQDCINVRYFEEVVEVKDELYNQEGVAEEEVSKDIDNTEKSEPNSREVVDDLTADIDIKFKEDCNRADNLEAAEVEESKVNFLNDDVCE